MPSNYWNCWSNIKESIGQGDVVNVIYLDFCKAFDKVPDKRLLIKSEGTALKEGS